MIDRFSAEFEFLSNFFPSEQELGGMKYRSVEHAYQAAKTLDRDERNRIRDAQTPGQAKRLGRKVKLRKDWESIKLQVMEDLLKQKFRPQTELALRLLATGDEQLVEGNHWNDRFWGVCDGQGQNYLGRLLMKVRDGLSGQPANPP